MGIDENEYKRFVSFLKKGLVKDTGKRSSVMDIPDDRKDSDNDNDSFIIDFPGLYIKLPIKKNKS